MTKHVSYCGTGMAALLVVAFVLVQPYMQTAYGVGIEQGIIDYDDCTLRDPQPEFAVTMNSIRRGEIVKTIYAEKEIFDCELDTSGDVVADVTTYIEIYENIDDMDVIEESAIATICLKQLVPPQTLDCESYDVARGSIPVGSICNEETDIGQPQQMNTVRKANIVKTIEAQKEVFTCVLNSTIEKKVDIILFTDVYENLNAGGD